MQEGLDHCIPSTSSAESSTQIHIAYCPPADEAMWVDIKDPSSAGKVILNNSNIVAYFVSRSVYDGPQQVILKLLINQHSICFVVAMFRSLINLLIPYPVQ